MIDMGDMGDIGDMGDMSDMGPQGYGVLGQGLWKGRGFNQIHCYPTGLIALLSATG